MSRSQKPRKPYKQKSIRTPMIVGASLVISPLESIVNQISNDGTVDVRQGVPQFMATDGLYYPTTPAIEGVIYHFEIIEMRHGIKLPLEPLRQFRIALEYCVPITESLLEKLKDSLTVLRKTLSYGDAVEQLDILRNAQIKFEMERLAA